MFERYDNFRRNEMRAIGNASSRNGTTETRKVEFDKMNESEFNREFQADFHKRIAELGVKN